MIFCSFPHPATSSPRHRQFKSLHLLQSVLEQFHGPSHKAGRFLSKIERRNKSARHINDSREYLRSLSPMEEISEIQDIVDAVVYLTEARHVTGEVLHVDSGAHIGKW
jgi:hypothetical protein